MRVAGFLDLATNTLFRAMSLQIEIYNAGGFFAWLRTTVAVADVAESEAGPVIRYVAVSNPRVIPIISKFLEPGERLVETTVRAHAEKLLIEATKQYAIKYSIGAGRAICWSCMEAILEAGFRACGPSGNPWFN